MFLETLDLTSLQGGDFTTGILVALFLQFLFFFAIVAIGLWVYSSLALMAIAKKAKHPSPGLVWIPYVGPGLVTSKIANMPWWPVLLLAGFWIPIVGGLAVLTYFIFSIIWLWKTFEAIKKPGFWAVLQIIPIVGLVLLGIAAWSKK
jgi:hypothetical protein